MSETPLFSIVIPLYNCRDYIAEAIRSVLDQTFQDFEIVVIDDGSTDKSAEAVKSFNDPRICYIRQDNQGVSAARNAGIEASRGEFIAFLDADDYWHHQHLAMAYKAFENHDINWYASRYSRTKERYSDNTSVKNILGTDSLQLHEYCKSGFHYVCSSSVVMRKTAIGNLRFEVDLSIGEDLRFWFEFSLENPLVAVSENIAVFYYIRPDSVCNTQSARNVKLLEYFCDIMIAEIIPDKYNFLFLNNIYVLFYWNLYLNGRKSALATVKKYKKYLSWNIRAILTITVYFSFIFKFKAAKIAYLYFKWRQII